jgi:hypothetical protein
MGADITAEGEDGGEVYLDDLIPIIVGKFRTGMATLDSCTIHEDMDFMSIFQNCWREGSDFRLGRQICCVDCSFFA